MTEALIMKGLPVELAEYDPSMRLWNVKMLHGATLVITENVVSDDSEQEEIAARIVREFLGDSYVSS